MFSSRRLSLRIAGLLPLAFTLAVGGCRAIEPNIEDVYIPALHYERHPIEVAGGTMRLEVKSIGRLSVSQEEEIARFAQEASGRDVKRLVIRRPQGGPSSDATAGRITHMLIDHGVRPDAIIHERYSGAKGAPVILTYRTAFAVTNECGDWSDSLTHTGRNKPPVNLGCAHQHNIAAVVANPEDFATPRTMTARDSMRRYQMYVDYRKPKPTSTLASDAEDAQISEVAKQ
jgi:pilus assembly protein CpaD